MNDLNEKKNTQADPGSLDSLREEFGADNKHFQRWQVLMVYDAVAVNIAYLAALWLRHDCQFSAIEARFLNPWKGFAPFYTVAALLVFWFLRLYKSVWRFASYTELVRICMASVITFVIHTVGITMMYRRMPMTYYFFGAILQFNPDVSAFLLAEFRFQRMLSDIFKILGEVAGIDLDMLAQG